MGRRIVIVEDQTVFREMLSMLLREDGFSICGTFATGTEARRSLDALDVELVVIDLMLPDMSGLELCRSVCRTHPDARVLVLTAHEKEAVVAEAVKAGAHGIMMKNASFDDLRFGVSEIANGRTFRCPRTRELLRASSNASDEAALTPREFEILRLVSMGKSTKGIADRLHLSPKTVSNHRFNIGKKLGLTDVASWTRYAIEKGWLWREHLDET